MIDRQTYLRLQDVIRREGRSFLQYADESFPWNAPGDGAAVEEVRQLATAERDGAAALSRYLVKHRLTPPYLGAYPSYFTSYNFMAVDRLLPLLVDHQKRGVGELEGDLKAVKDEDTHKQVADILAMKQRHLKALEALVTK